ncbi:hypothetical protein BURCENBC7_AP7567, partial [Burkholderia cenocepacia BC7]
MRLRRPSVDDATGAAWRVAYLTSEPSVVVTGASTPPVFDSAP